MKCVLPISTTTSAILLQKNPAQVKKGTSTGAETEATETDSAKETTPNATTGSDAGQTTKGNFHKEKNKS